MPEDTACTCGHDVSEHEPGCVVEDCDCIHFEWEDDDA